MGLPPWLSRQQAGGMSRVGCRQQSPLGQRSAVTLGVTVPRMDHSLEWAVLCCLRYDPGTQIYDTSEKARAPAWSACPKPCHAKLLIPHRPAPHRLQYEWMDGLDPPAALHTVAHTYCAQTMQYNAVWSGLVCRLSGHY